MQDMVLLRQVGLPSHHLPFIIVWFLIFLPSLHTSIFLLFFSSVLPFSLFLSPSCLFNFHLFLLPLLFSCLIPTLFVAFIYLPFPIIPLPPLHQVSSPFPSSLPLFHLVSVVMACSCVYPESGHLVDHQSDLEPVHGGFPALLASEETQQEDDPQSPEENNSGGQRASSGRPGPAGGRHEHVPGRCTRSLLSDMDKKTKFNDFDIKECI